MKLSQLDDYDFGVKLSGWHSGGGSYVYAVASYLVSGRKPPTAAVGRAIAELEGSNDTVRAEKALANELRRRFGTRVIFRKYRDGSILAIFPDEAGGLYGCDVMCYQHVGQHGSGNYDHMIAQTKPATPEEYASLKEELETLVGYTLRVASKR